METEISKSKSKKIRDLILRQTILKLTESAVRRIAETLGIHIPVDLSFEDFPDYLSNNLIDSQKDWILAMFRDAVKAASSLYVLQDKLPSFDELKNQLESFDFKDDVGTPVVGKPYFIELESNEISKLILLRFRYLGSRLEIFDEKTGETHLLTPSRSSLVVLHPETKIIEARTSVRKIVRSVIRRSVSILSDHIKLGDPTPLNLYTQDSIRKFLGWIEFLNYAGFEFDAPEEISTEGIAARPKIDLRETRKFRENFEKGWLRRGHATIKMDEDHHVNFRIFFRDARLTFTSLSDENDIKFVVSGIGQISEGKQFRGPTRVLSEFFD